MPRPAFKLCDHTNELPTDADEFFWGESVFDRLGRFKGLNDEMRTIVLESLAAYPLRQIEAARERGRAATGEGREPAKACKTEVWHTYGMIENFTPPMLPAMRAARQQNGELDFTGHQPPARAGRARLDAAAARA